MAGQRSRFAWLPLLAALATQAQAADVDVRIEGVEGELAANVRIFLSIADEHEEPWSDARIRRLHQRAPDEIRRALQPFGYYRPSIDSRLEPDGDDWNATYRIDPGRPTRIESLTLELRGPGADQPALREIVAASELAEGKRLDHRDYKDTKSRLTDTAYSTGYLDAGFVASELRIHPRRAAAEVRLVFDTGERHYFGPVEIEQDILNPDFMARYVPFEAGDPFSPERLIDLQLALSDSEYFSRVEVQAQRDRTIRSPETGPGPQVPVTVATEPRAPRRYTASVGYGTDTGFRVGLGAEFRHINRRGHRFRTDLRVSEIERALTARYVIPIENVRRDSLSFGATVGSEEIGDARTDLYGLSVSREDGWALGRRRFYLNLERERFDFHGEEVRTTELLYPGVTFGLQRTDDPLRPRLGASLSLDLRGGSEAVLSATDFFRTVVTAAVVLPATARGRLLARVEAGAAETDDFGALPPSQRFFAGGSRSVRGYGYQQIGPENEEGEVIGGQYLVALGLEAEYLFYRNYGAAVFFDVGDAATAGLDLKRGIGVGFRWRTPIGMLRIDFAHPLDDPDSNFRVHFSLGPDL